MTGTRTRGDSTLVFIGPSLTADEARELLPDATILPPAAVGDILRAAHDKRVVRIALIDGYFERMAAVWHKEILVALERGIEVWGAASMGALRAAELHPFGMRGVGEVFQLYKRGLVTADDEVAVAHLPAEYGYRAVSDALVNIRVSLQALVAADIVSRAHADLLFARSQARFYRERSWARVYEDAREAKLSERQIQALERAPKIDAKVDDARRLLRALRAGRRLTRRRIRVPRTWALRQLERLML